ncbi:hypothetical protein AB0J90_24025 [Micromonospora sp. NPDC049523]
MRGAEHSGSVRGQGSARPGLADPVAADVRPAAPDRRGHGGAAAQV